MPFDGITTREIVKELNNTVAGGRIRKVYQPEKDEIRLVINKPGNNMTLLLSANPNHARIHITETSKKNPDVAPNFCMSLRKHLTNSIIESVEQLGSDRVVVLNIQSKNELGEPCRKRIICEITGRNSNIILTEEDTIIDSIKRIGSTKSRFRQILPGLPYIEPPNENRRSFYEIDKEDLLKEIEDSFQTVESYFVKHFLGISPALMREVAFRSKVDSSANLRDLSAGERERLINALIYILSEKEEVKPQIFKQNYTLLDFYPIKLNNLGAQEQVYDTYSQMLEDFYHLRDKNMYFKAKSLNLKKQLEGLRKKSAKKLQNLDKDLKKTYKNENYKHYADLITANIWQLKKGMTEAELLDYTKDPPETVTVPLKINESPAQNAQRLYKRYNKDKRAQEQLSVQIKKTQEELNYIESLLNALNTSTELEELDEIRYEFNNSNLVNKSKRNKVKKPAASKPLHFKSSEGFDIYVGKNNYQNDYITTRLGTDEDCWLHVKDAPGAHVLIVADDKFITEQTVLEGGMLAAYYSNQRQSENVAVDYMEHKFVKKPKGAKPGMVIFTQHNTMYVDPDETVVKGLEEIQ